jgi:hypothetical protein
MAEDNIVRRTKRTMNSSSASIWTYGFELWGCASKSNITIIQRFLSKLLRATVNAPWYITNAMIHSDLGIPTVQDVIHKRSNKHRAKLQSLTIPIMGQYPTETETKMANCPVIRSKRFPHWREPHHGRKSTGWTLASSLAYGIHCTPIADQINIKKIKEKD